MSSASNDRAAAGPRPRTRSCAKALVCHRCDLSYLLEETVFACPQCGDPHQPHTVCPNCGYYRKAQRKEVEEF